jgi:hypothetical protein
MRLRRVAAGIGLSACLSTTAKYVRRAAISAAGNDYGTTIKYLQRARSAAANNGLGIKIKYLVNLARERATTGPRPTYTRAVHDFR